MASTQPLAIHFEPDPRSKAVPLEDQVLRIIAQRGAFRNINEASLRAEINQPKSSKQDESVDGSDGESDQEETANQRTENLWKSRDEFLQRLSYAQNEVLSALDFVSLLLSKHSVAAKASMSPALTAAVESGTVDGRVVQPKDPSTKTKQRLNEVADGWKLQSFTSAARKLDSSSLRLKKEAEQQNKYWAQIAQLTAQGWAVSRLPSDSRAIGVHFGFPESAPQFRNRGFALLQQDEDGNLDFDIRTTPRKRKPVSFLVMKNGSTVGSYTTVGADLPSSNISVRLTEARDALFEEELFYEMSREARLVANQDVRTQTMGIEADIDQNYSIRIQQHEHLSLPTAQSRTAEHNLAKFVAIMARLLLTAEHNRLRDRRSQPPPAMSMIPVVVPEHAILRPILTYLRHQVSVRKLLDLMKTFVRAFRCAGIALDLSIQQKSSVSFEDTVAAIDSVLGSAETIIILSTPAATAVTHPSITITLTTSLSSPHYGTTYGLTRNSSTSEVLGKTSTHNFVDLKQSLSDMLTLHLVSVVQSETKTGIVRPGFEWELKKSYSGEFEIKKANSVIGRMSIGALISTGNNDKSGSIALKIAERSEHGKESRRLFVWNERGVSAKVVNGREEESDQQQKEKKVMSLKEVLENVGME